ncbi:hypothetical protein [Lentzea sp. NPDC060358]|uniref:hypothetical protein n=1 Tax=Lentzea sp. NPDC060358 TaxID=3347103 RepID=UPI0036528CA0
MTTAERLTLHAGTTIPVPDEPAHERAWFGMVAAFAGSMAFLLLIPAGWARLDRLWAEDGAVFTVQARLHPLPHNLFEPYGGYLHTAPRLVAEVAALLPIEWTAAVFALTAAALRALVALIAFAGSRACIESTPLRFALAALVIVLPVGNSEPLNNMANLHWFLLFGTFWALVWRNAPSVPVASFVFLTALSSPLAFVLLPIALVRMFLPRREVPIAFIVGLVVQAVVMALSTRTAYSQDQADPVQVLLASLLRVPVAAFTGSEKLGDFYPAMGNSVIVAALVVALVPMAAGVRFGNRATRTLIVTSAVLSVVVIVVCLVLNWALVMQVQQPGVVLAGQRYSVAPCLFLFTAILAGLDRTPAPAWGRAVVAGSRYVVGLLVVVSVFWFLQETTPVLRGVPWDESVANARLACAEGSGNARLEQAPEDWAFTVPCDELG